MRNLYILAGLLVMLAIGLLLLPEFSGAAYTNNSTVQASASTYSANATNGTVYVSAHTTYWQYVVRGGKQDWDGADYYCDNLSLGTNNATSTAADWELPSVRALSDIYFDSLNTVTDPTPVQHQTAPVDLTQMTWEEGYYWTSSPGVAVQFIPRFDIITTTKDNYFHVRCVNY